MLRHANSIGLCLRKAFKFSSHEKEGQTEDIALNRQAGRTRAYSLLSTTPRVCDDLSLACIIINTVSKFLRKMTSPSSLH